MLRLIVCLLLVAGCGVVELGDADRAMRYRVLDGDVETPEGSLPDRPPLDSTAHDGSFSDGEVRDASSLTPDAMLRDAGTDAPPGNDCQQRCGGPCPLCENGRACSGGADCVSGYCSPTKLCAAPPPTCSDKIKNQNESDVDCGGSCPDCANGKGCSGAGDCVSGYCNASKLCAAPPPTCSDKIKNQNESDVDCGGTCAGCANGKSCNSDSDCLGTSYCNSSKTCTEKPPLWPGTIIFSPSPRQSDHPVRYDTGYDASWKSINGAYDILNLHAADIWTRSDAYLQKIKARVGTKPIALEMQSTAGLLHFGKEATGSCNPALGEDHARSCGHMAADAWYNGGTGGLGLYRLKNQGLNVKYIMLDSAFYAPYRQILYFHQNGAYHTAAGASKAIAFMDGFMSRMQASDKFGSGLKFIFISHFKYEYVAGKYGFKNRHDARTCFNTCFTGAKWNDEDAVVNYVLNKLPGRFDLVLFDASWSSFYATSDGWSRWDKMLATVNSHGVKVGNIVMSDAEVGQDCGHHECWFSDSTACVAADEKRWWVHNMSYVDTMIRGNGLISNYKQIDAMMVASWHRLPRSTFNYGNVCSIPMEDILRCTANSLGRYQINCPTH